jgi:hypothetical protein
VANRPGLSLFARSGAPPPAGEISEILKRYRLREVHGDKYAANWFVEAFKRADVSYRQTQSDNSVYYLELEPLFPQGKIEILDHPELARELQLLDRRPRPGGKTIIDHPRSMQDDYSNSLAIATTKAKKLSLSYGFHIGVGHSTGWLNGGGDYKDDDGDCLNIGTVIRDY